MRDGFYSVHNAVGDQDDPTDDGDEYVLAILAHLKDGRFVGVDQGGCKLIGTYETQPDGRTTVHVAYTFKAGTELPNGLVFDNPTTIERDVILSERTLEGEPQSIDFGFGPQYVRLAWLSEAAES